MREPVSFGVSPFDCSHFNVFISQRTKLSVFFFLSTDVTIQQKTKKGKKTVCNKRNNCRLHEQLCVGVKSFQFFLSHVVCSLLLLTLCRWITCYIDLVVMFVTFFRYRCHCSIAVLTVRTCGEMKGAELKEILCPKFPVDPTMHTKKSR